jgi:hypothetical protein
MAGLRRRGLRGRFLAENRLGKAAGARHGLRR